MQKASAKMAEGILEIRLPKLEPRHEKKARRLTLPTRSAMDLS
jgi:HSP20 family molecular chaperone IbpA